jgi:glycosyltransferase involved in cell wall biosynthesis
LHNIYHQLTPAIIPLLKSRGVKVVLTLHDGKLVCPSYLMLNKGRICEACRGRRFHRSIFSRCQGSMSRGALLTAEAYWHRWRGSYDHVDRFVAPSDFLGDLVTRRRVPREKMTVLRNGIDLEEYRPHYTDQGYVLYFGRLSQEKGIQTLLAAHETMARPIPLKVVGTGPVQDDLRSRFTTAEFLGYKEGNELRELVGKAAFVVVPSEWYENCSMVVLEAMALGKPVIGSRIGGIPEQIDDGKTGFLFQMGDQAELARKMDTLLAEPELRARMGRAARRKIQNEFSLDAHCTRLLSIYHELLHS